MAAAAPEAVVLVVPVLKAALEEVGMAVTSTSVIQETLQTLVALPGLKTSWAALKLIKAAT